MVLDGNDSVVYIGNLWKTLYPLVNIGFLVLPSGLIEPFKKIQSLAWVKSSTSIPFLEQTTLTDFINEGLLERHIRKTRLIYAGRYRNLITGLTRFFDNEVDYEDESGSMQLLIRFDPSLAESKILESARRVGLPVVRSKPYYCNNAPVNEFLISFVSLNENEMLNRLEQWSSCLFGFGT